MTTILNPMLIKKQGLNSDEVAELNHLHEVREDLFKLIKDLDPTVKESEFTFEVYVSLLESLEYNMQRVWKFPQNKLKHTWWNRVPHCTCDKNQKYNSFTILRGRYINDNCPLHSKKYWENLGEKSK